MIRKLLLKLFMENAQTMSDKHIAALERKITVLEYDLKQTRINHKSELTRLRNQNNKLEDRVRRLHAALDEAIQYVEPQMVQHLHRILADR